MKIAVIADPLSTFDQKSETTFFLAHAFCQNGVACHFVEIKNLFLVNGDVLAKAQKVKVTRQANSGLFSFKIQDEAEINLAHMDAVWLRKDPPVNQAFTDHLSVLELLKGKTRLINDPTGIKHAPEKIFALSHKDLGPETLITQNPEKIFAFVQKQKRVVLKPLNLSGGRGIVIAESGKKDLRSLIEILTKNGSEFICAQKFVPAAAKGDKRVLLWQGEVLGAFLRVPKSSDFRGNLHSGAVFKKTTLTAREKRAVQTLLPDLKAWGLHFVGLDFLGELVTEVNVTSPMGLAELNTLYASQFEKIVVHSLLKTKTNRF